jgi:hypothetical protein
MLSIRTRPKAWHTSFRMSSVSSKMAQHSRRQDSMVVTCYLSSTSRCISRLPYVSFGVEHPHPSINKIHLDKKNSLLDSTSPTHLQPSQ